MPRNNKLLGVRFYPFVPLAWAPMNPTETPWKNCHYKLNRDNRKVGGKQEREKENNQRHLIDRDQYICIDLSTCFANSFIHMI